MCCKDIVKKLGGTETCVIHNSSVATGTGGRRFEVERRSAHEGCCSISIDKIGIKGTAERCDNVICICHKVGKEAVTSHYFVEFKDSKSSRKPFGQIEATITFFQQSAIALRNGYTHAAIITTGGIHSSLTAKKDIWVREFLRKYGTRPIISNGQHKMQF